MNLRLLKKLSKRAAGYILILDKKAELFLAEKGQNFTAVKGHEFKHWSRLRSVHGDNIFKGGIKYRVRKDTHWISLQEPTNPYKGTYMIGWNSGYYEPEWVEKTAWEHLNDIVNEEFNGKFGKSTFGVAKIKSNMDIFKAAEYMVLSGSLN